jgi:membrane protease YdiL (CAAX protease family)
MNKLYKKSEIWFSVVLIIIYVVTTSVTHSISKAVTFAFHLVFSGVLFFWIKKNGFLRKYGLIGTDKNAKDFLYYIPLIFVSSVNLWFGLKMNMPIVETSFYVGSMLLVGFLEEVIFRGFLFKAMEKDSVKWAVIVSSVTFGIGHIVNLFNGSGADILSNVCQIFEATAFGFLFVIIFYRGKSLLPAIISHSSINALSAFCNEEAITPIVSILISIMLCAVVLSYALGLNKRLK